MSHGLWTGLILGLCLVANAALAETRQVSPGPQALANAIAGAAPGDELVLERGLYEGPVEILKPLIVTGLDGAILRGNGTGSVIGISGENITVRGLAIEGSGSNSTDIDSGIFVRETARNVTVEDNFLSGNLHGITLHGAQDVKVLRNRIEGRNTGHVNDRGNGIYVWNAPGALVEGNEIRWGRDGIFANVSKKDVFRGNLMRDLRFAVHYMYTNDSVIEGNVSIGNTLGYALMFSNKIIVKDNMSLADRQHGLMLNYANNAEVIGNLVRGGTTAKCTFIYNAHKNRITGNRFEGCGIGIHFTAGSERNAISGNAFIANQNQVKYVGSRQIEWSDQGRGNFWSDHAAFDLNGDGIADSPYRPNDLMDHILWSQPAAKLLLGSPAVQLVRWSQDSFPATLPGGVTDSFPLTEPISISVPARFIALEADAIAEARERSMTDDDPDNLASH
ncbi:nitrous oxide reductase family maturation protein NosD [Roseibium suaedae]|uniref:Nitrous oxidase accessory protein n=1 Tax=Roseibium suaedae TaxID=735517 RepID=A0A1M7NWP4_9HYPH|nr:nitrous oxide reductase family maturation protein NosD [Roseibium suaedae]SHN08507.1 nitrous oxidase accessory protein [Roseibium suaedae]